ncbi:acyltransferase domain-containing protein, partial [candidate division KSB1 bacterium]|nr:acyltransferase domain-containing protein [candidate division KSB1 bacterium]
MSASVKLPAHMRAVVLHEFDKLDALVVEQKPVPQPRAGQVLVRMHAAPINPSDLAALRGLYRVQKTLPAVAKVYADFLRSGDSQGIPPEDICYTAALHRKHFPQRLAVIGRDREDLASGIEAFINGAARANVCVGTTVTDRRPRVAFVFPGQGTQWPGMGRRLLDCSPVFREAVEEVDALFHPLGSWSILEEMARPAQESRLEETAYAQPALFALQIGLAAMWKSWGVEPDSVLGHSMGEAAAAFVAGALSLDDAVKVIHHRSRLMQRATGTGQMVSVSLPLEE